MKIEKDDLKSIPILNVCTALGISLDHSNQSAVCPTGHESKDGKCFSVKPDENFFKCFSCGAGGDVIRLVEIAKGIGYKDALGWLHSLSGGHFVPCRPAPALIKKEPEKRLSDTTEWQKLVEPFVTYSFDQLWKHQDMMTWYQNERGLNRETLSEFTLGYNPKVEYLTRDNALLRAGDGVINDPLWAAYWQEQEAKIKAKHGFLKYQPSICFSHGPVIPYMPMKPYRIARVRVRKGPGDYQLLKGSAGMPYTIDTGAPVWMIVESEFDAMLIRQEAGDLVSVAALGSVRIKPDALLKEKLDAALLILISLDNERKADGADGPGRTETARWLNEYPNARHWPCTRGKDPADMHKAGLHVRKWVELALKHYQF